MITLIVKIADIDGMGKMSVDVQPESQYPNDNEFKVSHEMMALIMNWLGENPNANESNAVSAGSGLDYIKKLRAGRISPY
jgi:hypothetical protein